jgi:hypothetical protein
MWLERLEEEISFRRTTPNNAKTQGWSIAAKIKGREY